LVLTKEERKAYNKEYYSRPEVKAKAKEKRDRPEYRAKAKEYDQTPERKARRKTYRDRPEYRAKAKEYDQTPERKARDKERKSIPENKAKRKNERNDIRLKVLQYYSKLLSNSNIPCCRCCGLNSTVTFLAIDHIAGIKEMDSEPELIKLGYSSKLKTYRLNRWIMDNNFPEGFQILCHNCNFAKGMKKNNNKCPLEGKPH